MTTQFWTNEPTILFNKNYIFELWPTKNMMYTEKLNAISRLIILLTILGYILTFSLKVLSVGITTLLIIFVLFKMKKQKPSNPFVNEGFQVDGTILRDLSNVASTTTNPVTLETILKSEFKEGNKKNPFSNVLLTQITDEPTRKSAPPAFNPDVEEDITKNVKRSVQQMNPGIKNTNKQLYGDLWSRYELDQSNRNFYSTPNTRIPNDQTAYAKFLYSDMKHSGKLSTPEGAITRVEDSYRYTLY